MAIVTPPDPQRIAEHGCNETIAFWNYTHTTTINLEGCTVTGNQALAQGSDLSSGGGLYLGPGGLMTVTACIFTNNWAALVGGAIAGGRSGNMDTCSMAIQGGSRFSNNTGAHGANELFMGCSADLVVQDTQFQLGVNGTQVRLGKGTVETP